MGKIPDRSIVLRDRKCSAEIEAIKQKSNSAKDRKVEEIGVCFSYLLRDVLEMFLLEIKEGN